MGNVDVTFLISTKFCIIINRCHNMFRAHVNDPNTDADSDQGTLASEAIDLVRGHQQTKILCRAPVGFFLGLRSCDEEFCKLK